MASCRVSITAGTPLPPRRRLPNRSWQPPPKVSVVVCRGNLIALALTGLAMAGIPGARGGEPSAPPRPPAATVSADWTGLPFRDLCQRLGDVAGKPVILDRRIDPGTPMTLSPRDEPLEKVLEAIADAAGVGCALLASSIRFVPPGTAARLVAADEQRTAAIKRLTDAARGRALERREWSWPAGARPRELLAALAEASRIEITGLDAIPHDHLAAADLPPLPLAERFDLLLAQFDRRIDWSSWQGAAADEPLPPLVIVPLPVVDGDSPTRLAIAPGAQAGAVRGTPTRGDRPRPQANDRVTWTLEVAAPLEQLLATVSKRLELELDLDRAGLRAQGVDAREIVRLRVKEVDRDQLLDAILAPLDLGWSIDGGRLRVGPARAEAPASR
jgi:hypothetical protein